MKWRNVAVVAEAALATALVALALFWTGRAVANEGQRPEIKWPAVRHRGCEIRLRTDQTSYQPGQMPTVELTAANPAASPISLDATIRMMVQPLASPMSRRMPSVRRAWEHKWRLSLQAGERKTLSIPTDTKLAGKTMVFFQLTVGRANVNTRPIAIAAPGPILAQGPR